MRRRGAAQHTRARAFALTAPRGARCAEVFNTAEVKRFVSVMLDETGMEYTAFCPGKGREAWGCIPTVIDALT